MLPKNIQWVRVRRLTAHSHRAQQRQVKMSLYEARCLITLKFNQSAIQDLVLEHAKGREAA